MPLLCLAVLCSKHARDSQDKSADSASSLHRGVACCPSEYDQREPSSSTSSNCDMSLSGHAKSGRYTASIVHSSGGVTRQMAVLRLQLSGNASRARTLARIPRIPSLRLRMSNRSVACRRSVPLSSQLAEFQSFRAKPLRAKCFVPAIGFDRACPRTGERPCVAPLRSPPDQHGLVT